MFEHCFNAIHLLIPQFLDFFLVKGALQIFSVIIFEHITERSCLFDSTDGKQLFTPRRELTFFKRSPGSADAYPVSLFHLGAAVSFVQRAMGLTV